MLAYSKCSDSDAVQVLSRFLWQLCGEWFEEVGVQTRSGDASWEAVSLRQT